MTDKKLEKYDNPTGDEAYDEWYAEHLDRVVDSADDSIWDKFFDKPTGSFSKLAEVERNLKRKKG